MRKKNSNICLILAGHEIIRLVRFLSPADGRSNTGGGRTRWAVTAELVVVVMLLAVFMLPMAVAALMVLVMAPCRS